MNSKIFIKYVCEVYVVISQAGVFQCCYYHLNFSNRIFLWSKILLTKVYFFVFFAITYEQGNQCISIKFIYSIDQSNRTVVGKYEWVVYLWKNIVLLCFQYQGIIWWQHCQNMRNNILQNEGWRASRDYLRCFHVPEFIPQLIFFMVLVKYFLGKTNSDILELWGPRFSMIIFFWSNYGYFQIAHWHIM